MAETQVKRRFWLFQCYVFVVRAVSCKDHNMCSRNPLVTLCASDRSRCGTVLTWLAPVTWISLCRGAHFEIARATPRHFGFVSILGTPKSDGLWVFVAIFAFQLTVLEVPNFKTNWWWPNLKNGSWCQVTEEEMQWRALQSFEVRQFPEYPRNNLTGGDRESWGLLCDSPKGSRCEREGRTMALLERCWLPFVFVYYVSVLMCIVNCLHVVHVKMFKGRTSKPCPGERVEAQQTVQVTHIIKQRCGSDFLKLASGGYVFTKSRGLDRT